MRAPALGGYLLPQRQSSQREPGHVSKRAAGLDVWAPHLLGVPAKERGNATSRVTPNGSNSSRLHTQLRRRSGVGESQRPSVQRHSTAANNVKCQGFKVAESRRNAGDIGAGAVGPSSQSPAGPRRTLWVAVLPGVLAWIRESHEWHDRHHDGYCGFVEGVVCGQDL